MVETLDVIQHADTDIPGGTDLYAHMYSFKQVEAILKCQAEILKNE